MELPGEELPVVLCAWCDLVEHHCLPAWTLGQVTSHSVRQSVSQGLSLSANDCGPLRSASFRSVLSIRSGAIARATRTDEDRSWSGTEEDEGHGSRAWLRT